MSINFELAKNLIVEGSDMIFDTQFHPTKDNMLAVCTIEGDVKIIDTKVDSNNIVMDMKRHHKGSPVRKIRFASSEMLVSAAKTLKLLDLNTGQVVRKIENSGQKIYSLLVIDNYLLCAGDDSGAFKVWDYRIDRGIYMDSNECEGYISDLDIDETKRIVLATSGEGTLSAFNIRAKRMDLQSELFDAGFQSVRYMEAKGKAVVGAEDGAINIFNVNEWGNISDRFPIRGQTTRGQGLCSVDNIELINDEVIIVGSSDGLLRAINILPNKVIKEISKTDSSVESLDVNQISKQIAATYDNILQIFNYTEIKGKVKQNCYKSEFFADLAPNNNL